MRDTLGSVYGPPAANANPGAIPEHAPMLEPLAGLDRPAGQATATALALYVPSAAVIEFIVVSDVSARAAASPGQNVDGDEQRCISATSV